MKKLLLGLLINSSLMVSAQVSTSMGSANNNWVFGGSAGLHFGSYESFGISVSPRVGYRITPDLVLGLGAGYTYQGNKYYSNSMFDIGPFANYYIGRNFYLSADFKEYFMSLKNKESSEKFNHEESALYLGAGYMQQIGNRAFLQIGASYNVLYKKNESYFSNGFVPNIGVVFGL